MLDRELVMQRLNYDKHSGKLRWRTSSGGRVSGSEAGSINSKGYRILSVSGQLCKAHQIAWLIAHGEWPAGWIDHIDGNKDNNAISNLRLASPSQNVANTGLRRTNSSGFKGVHWSKAAKKWKAAIVHNSSLKYLGIYESKLDAAKAYDKAASELFGEYAKTNESMGLL